MMLGCQRSISGAYIASDNNAVVWLQVVRTSDNHLTGEIESTVLNSDGTVTQKSTAISGAIDGDNVTIEVGGLFGLGASILSGTRQGNVLTLSGSQGIPLTFMRSTSTELQSKLTALNASSKSIIRGKAEAQAQQRAIRARSNLIAQISELVTRMSRFDSETGIHLGKFPGAEKAYRAITAKVAGYVARERQLAGNPSSGVARGQLTVAANQASIQTEQLHNQVGELQSSFESAGRSIGDEAGTFLNQCKTQTENGAAPTPIESQDVIQTCDQLRSATPRFKAKFNAMSEGLARLEQIYKQERDAQRILLQEANRLE